MSISFRSMAMAGVLTVGGLAGIGATEAKADGFRLNIAVGEPYGGYGRGYGGGYRIQPYPYPIRPPHYPRPPYYGHYPQYPHHHYPRPSGGYPGPYHPW